MQFKNVLIVLSTFLLLFLTKVSNAQLQCYECNDCAHIASDTPQVTCNEDYFASGGTTLPSTMTTTDDPTMESTTTDESTTVSESSSVSDETTIAETTESTSPTPPSPPTAGTPETVPTPPVFSTAQPEQASNDGDSIYIQQIGKKNDTQTVPVTELYFVRQRRSVRETNFTYHCYWVNKIQDGKTITVRGCSQVATHEGVCEQLQNENNATTLSNCYPCSNNLCNGSNALKFSALAIIIGLLTTFLKQN